MVTRIAIVGGGTAGWLAAALLSRHCADTDITLIESPDIPVIGVGEGTFPSTMRLLRGLDLSTAEIISRCNAGIKLGIQYRGFTQEPFWLSTEPKEWWQQHGHEMTKAVAISGRAPAIGSDDDGDTFAMHFVASDMADLLRDVALRNGVKHLQARVTDVAIVDDHCQWIGLDRGTLITADWYVDCSGFASLLIGRTSSTFHSYSDDLLVDSAVVGPTAYADPRREFVPYTRITAHAAGWRFRIPTQSRVGNGVVYSSRHMTPDEAETLLVTETGVESPKHLRMRLGYHDRLFVGNVAAVGLSGGFIEPLEATAIHIAEQTVGWLMGIIRDQIDPALANQGMAQKIAYIKTLIQAHYAWCDRDEPFWADARAAARRSGELDHFLASMRNGRFPTADDTLDDAYPWCQWNELLRGFGRDHHYPTLSSQSKQRIYMASTLLPNHWDHVRSLRG